ncbi:MAG: hypothetical protein DMF91_14545 [Acidobacteria bacterium]|nr:MAG: hypothetical protein DMF91_14545 [Acidobacteriota bacterium]
MIRDVRDAFRTIVRKPALAAVVIISIGAGIGVNTVVFSWIQMRIFQPLPGVSGSGSLHGVEPRTDAGIYTGVSWLEYQDLRERLRAFRELLAFRMVALYVGETGQVQRAYGLLVSGNYFSALGLQPAIGRFFQPEEVLRAGGEPVAVISYGFWQTRFSGAPSVVGRNLRVNGRDLTIVGVTPKPFQGTVLGLNFDVWLPATLAPAIVNGSRELEDRGARGYSVLGRLQRPATREQAQHELDAAMRQLAQAYPDTNATLKGEVLPFWQLPGGPQRLLTAALAILQAIMLLLLLAVCGNTANLVLARASARQREMGVRLALGAGPWRIARLMLTESVLLALLGAALGVAIAVWGTQALIVLPLSGLPIRFQTSVDIVGLAFAMALGVVSGLIFGAAPAMQLARLDPAIAYRSGLNTGSWCSSWRASSSAASWRRATRIRASGATACCSRPTISRAAMPARRLSRRFPAACWSGFARCRPSRPRPSRHRCRWIFMACRRGSSPSRGARGPMPMSIARSPTSSRPGISR